MTTDIEKPNLQFAERLLRKVKLNNNGTAEVKFRDYYVDNSTGQRAHNDVEHKSDDGEPRLAHDDLRSVFKFMDQHWMIRGDEVPEPKGNYSFDGSLKGLERVTVTSVTFSGGEPEDPESGEERSPIAVHIQGTMQLRAGHVKNYCLPPIKLGAPQEKYKFATHLDQHVQMLEAEAMAYIAGKCAPPAQQAMNFDGLNPEDGSAIESDDIKALGEHIEQD